MNIFEATKAKKTEPARTAVRRAIGWLETPLKLLAALTCFALLVGCGTQQNRTAQYTSRGVAVLGVSAKTGLETAINRNSLANDLTQLLVERGAFPVLPTTTLRQYIGAERVAEMLTRYAETSRVDRRDIKDLMSRGLPTSLIVVARLEEDYTIKLPARREAVLNRVGERLADREKRVLATQRVTSVSATLIDLNDGSEVWKRQFRVDPVAEAATTRYLGSSFSGSLAAAFANTMVNGVRVVRYPPAPTLRLSMISLLREIADSLPVR